MWQSIWGEKSARVAVLFFVIYSYWFLNLQQNPENIEQYDLFTVSYGLMAL